jgi:hypothetical protein
MGKPIVGVVVPANGTARRADCEGTLFAAEHVSTPLNIAKHSDPTKFTITPVLKGASISLPCPDNTGFRRQKAPTDGLYVEMEDGHALFISKDVLLTKLYWLIENGAAAQHATTRRKKPVKSRTVYPSGLFICKSKRR